MKNLRLNKKNNQGGMVTVDMDRVRSYELDPDEENQATRITFHDGTTLVVADTVSQIDLLLKWHQEGKIDAKGNVK